MKLGAIEAGGTKFVLATQDENGVLQDRISIPTTSPDETMKQVISYFKEHQVDAIGLGCFGPIDLNKKSDTYGYITNTPKLEWRQYNIVGALNELNVPVGFDTDVNVCAYAEWKLGAAKGLDSCLYMTVGTGIGAGAVVNGGTIKGMIHPEMGHVAVKRHPHDAYKGYCVSHHDCLEGLASGPAIEGRLKKKAEDSNPDCEGWWIVANYLAQGLYNYVTTLSVEKIIMGGGVMHKPRLFEKIHEEFKKINNDYLKHPYLDALEDYIVPPALGDDVGLIGCFLLAENELKENN